MWVESKALYTVKSYIWLLNPFFPLSTQTHMETKTKQEKKMAELNLLWIFSIPKPKTEDIFSHFYMMFLRRQMKHVNVLVRKDQQNE